MYKYAVVERYPKLQRTHRKIIEGKRAEIIALRTSEERYFKIFRNSPHMISIIKKSDYRYIDANNRFLSEGGFSDEDVIGKTPVELGLPESEFRRVMELFEELGSIENIESTLPMRHVTSKMVLLSAESIELNGEECIVFTSTDITEMKRMQAEISRLDRLSLIGQMAEGIAHQIRNPMTTVRGYLQLLGEKPEYGPQKSTFDLMIAELDRSNSIITEFLSLAKTIPTERRYQNLNDSLSTLYPLLEAEALARNMQIVFIQGGIPKIYLNTDQISQLVWNLCCNGLDAMKERGCLTICTYMESEQVVLKVQDEGSGIALNDIDKLGTPFFTTKDNRTGLGLAICYSIATCHKACIDVDTGPNGTSFLVRFEQAG